MDANGTSAGVPVWPMIYFCLRTGDIDAAIQAATEAGPGLAEMVSFWGLFRFEAPFYVL